MPAKDLVREPMKRETLPHSADQMTRKCLDVSDAGGALGLERDKVLADVPFKIR